VKFGYRGLAVTDFDGVYGLARSHLELKKILRSAQNDASNRHPEQSNRHPEQSNRHPEQSNRHPEQSNRHPEQSNRHPEQREGSLHLIHGMELHLAQDHDLPVIYRDTVVLIAMNRVGYFNLCRIASYSHRGGKAGAYVSPEDLLKFSTEGLAALQPMRGLIRRGTAEADLRRRWQMLSTHFSGRFYAVVSRHLNPGEDVWIAPTIRLAQQTGTRCLLSQDVFFHEPKQKDMSDLLHAVRTNLTLDQAVPHMFANSERSLHSLKGIAERFGCIPGFTQALINSRELAAQIDFSMDELRYFYPKEMIPEGFTAHSYLEFLVWDYAQKKYGNPLPGKITSVLARELELIAQLKFADYFLTVWDIVRWARSQNILCQGRGSAANSAVCFVLGVTAVDPSLFDLLFERFISVERGDPPDIDVDFEHERREEVIHYIYQRYGRDKAAMVANVITFRSRGSLRAVGKALGVREPFLGEVSKLLEARWFRKSGAENVLDHLKVNITEHVDEDRIGVAGNRIPDALRAGDDGAPPVMPSPLEAGVGHLDDIPWKIWGQMAERLKGFPRHLGIHSGGFMLADKPLDWLVAQEPATMEGRSVVQWSKEDIEGLGFFKIDILALGMLTAVRKSFTEIREKYGRDLTLATIPQEDPPTYAMIQRADTVGTFQIESRAQMSMLPRLRPRTFYDLVIEVAIIRPGPIQGGMIHPFLRRRDGIEQVTFPDERLRPILARTLGIPLFQEQVMRIAIAVGGFTGGEANELRKHMGAWSLKGDMGPWMIKLAAGMKKNGFKEDFIQQILGQMRGFADYGFPESHAVSFALIAYASSYLKCHYPAAFFMALLNSQPMGFYSPHALLQSAKRDGVKVLPVCINHSDYDNTLENVASAGKPPVFGIRLGLRLVTSLSKSGADEVMRMRREAGGKFADLEDFLKRSRLYRNDVTALAAANVFQIFGMDRRSAIWLAEAAPFCPVLEDLEEVVEFDEETVMEKIQQDFAATTTSLGPHPVSVIRKEHWCYDVPERRLVPAKDINSIAAGKMIELFGMVLVRQAPPSAKGMVFFTLEDETGFMNLVFTPQMYEKFYRLIEGQAFLCVRGRVQRQHESHSIMVSQVYNPTLRKADVIPLAETKEKPRPIVVEHELAPTRNYM
jgi:error-prone DNA polymerase